MRDEKFINKDMFLEARAIERENVTANQLKALLPTLQNTLEEQWKRRTIGLE